MNDCDILLSILLRYRVNIDKFCSTIGGLVPMDYVDYLSYCHDGSVFINDLSESCLDEFSFKFLVAALTWKGLL